MNRPAAMLVSAVLALGTLGGDGRADRDPLRRQQLHVRPHRSGHELQRRQRPRPHGTRCGSRIRRARTPFEPHPWGGVPGIFKKFTVQAGLDYDVSLSARNAATLRGQFLNSNPAGWDLRGNIAIEAVGQGRAPGAERRSADEAAAAWRRTRTTSGPTPNLIEDFVHSGAAFSYSERELIGGTTGRVPGGDRRVGDDVQHGAQRSPRTRTRTPADQASTCTRPGRGPT